MRGNFGSKAGASVTVILALSVALGCRSEGDGRRASEDCGKVGVWLLPEEMLAPPIDSEGAEDYVREDMTAARLNLLARSLEAFCGTRSHYPTDLRELADATSMDGEPCYFTEEILSDAWGRRMEYRLVMGMPRIVSAGPDGRMGSEDDLSTPNPTQAGAEATSKSRSCTGISVGGDS
jgi:type II secretion system (T2SS) protein G